MFQNNFIEALNGNHNQVVRPIAKVFNINNVAITALAIPSPGSPQRQLQKFGLNGHWDEYAKNYFVNAFAWLTE